MQRNTRQLFSRKPAARFSSRVSFPYDLPYADWYQEKVPLLQVFRFAIQGMLAGQPAGPLARVLRSLGRKPMLYAAECGVYRGHSLAAMAALARSIGVRTRFVGLDTFSGLPALSEMDRKLAPANARYLSSDVFGDTSLEEVRGLIEQAGVSDIVELYPGLFSETLPRLPERRYFFVNIDCDLYEPHLQCLDYFYRRTVAGGVLFFDDFHSAQYPMAKRAILDFLKDRPERPFHIRFGDDGDNLTKAFIVKY